MSNANWINNQFLPEANRYVDWLKTPIGWLIVASLASVMAASTLAPQMWIVFGVLVILIGLGVAWPMIAAWALSCELRFSRARCSEGEPVKVVVAISNRLWIPIWGLSLEKGFFEENTEDTGIAISLARIPAASTTEFEWEFEPKVRGIYPTVQPELTCGFPFGLWLARKPVRLTQKLIVWPTTFRLGFIPPAIGSDELVSETFADRSGTVGDRIGLRPFREGDSLRLVRWSQSARFDQLIVSEQQSPSRQTVKVIIRPVSPEPAGGRQPGGSEEQFGKQVYEDCIRIGASICTEFHRHGFVVQCSVESQDYQIDARSSSYRGFMDHLSRVEMSREESKTTIENTIDSNTTFLVTNSQSQLPSSLQQGNGILVTSSKSSEFARESDCDSIDAWIQVESGKSMKSEFPRLWVQKCHSSWQVCG